MIYAEALNELTGSYEIPSWDGSKVHSVKRDVTEMKKGIRPSVFVRDYRIMTMFKGMKQPMMIERIPDDVKTGTSIEFFAEEHRYWGFTVVG